MPNLDGVVGQLKQQRQSLAGELRRIDAALAALGATGAAPARRKASQRKAARKRMSAAQRKAVSARMKKYWAARRKAKG